MAIDNYARTAKGVAIAVAVLLYVSAQTASTAAEMSLDQYLALAQQEYGYKCALDRKSKDRVTIFLEKSGETEEGNGFLNIRWITRETWTLEFYRSEGVLKRFDKDSKIEKKAPWLGEWRTYEQKTRVLALPSELQVFELKPSASYGGCRDAND